ncbi:ABC-2 type transport system ATP-binding protein [Litorimonas taeanensis]|uniref:ABC-2 type transport system ATP-binding protein n=1 Tax=Litorimonas taeanensis TaxID=568099 RepID=A0A420WFL0_9PROT|nr:ABC transporter ATP-binding protein [Litorimonas taeanensis]RKQ69752.1 ABC-2 type transport system ATP-binding protein [Litorimonas taeanensis]
MSDAAIEIKNLQKTYKASRKAAAKNALKGVDLVVPRGSIFGLLGPNGAGKSTMINILAGLVNKSSGSAKICGYDIETQTRQARASIGIVPQEITMDVFFTPYQALEIQAGYYGVPKSQRRTEEILEALGLLDKRDAYVRQLSGGMKRRLLIAKALVHNPPVLILDEPTAGVDIELRRQLWTYVKELHRRGTTIILTTHYLEEAEALCDQIAIIHNGEITANESKTALLSRLDKRKLVITPTENLTTIPQSLQSLDAEISEEGDLVISYQAGTDSISGLLNQFKEAGLSIGDLRTEEPDLEDVFMALTYATDAA